MLEKYPFLVEMSKKIEKIIRTNKGYAGEGRIFVNTKNPVTITMTMTITVTISAACRIRYWLRGVKEL